MSRYDVIVVGFGFAGGMAAIAAHDAGAKVLILEKREAPGGISVCSAGGVRCSENPEAAFAYLTATNGGKTPPDVLRALADGMREVPGVVAGLAERIGAKAEIRPAQGNYPFPGYADFAFANVVEVPDFEPARDYPQVRGSPAGARLFRVVERNVALRGIEVRLETPATRLVVEGEQVRGVAAASERIMARGGVVLATGGFEGASALQQQFWPNAEVLSAAIRTNTGDGLAMAQSAGAALWHMWHYHGSYGFRHPDPAYPFGIRVKRLPDWVPGAPFREDVAMSWVIVDRTGRRFMNEYEPYMQDTGHRPFEAFDYTRQGPAHAPAILIVDARGRERYPLCAPTWNDVEVAARFGRVTPREMDRMVLREFATLGDLAAAFGVAADALETTLAEWNTLCATAAPDALGRPPESRMPIATPPFSAAQIWPVVSNTQGGPAHDARQRVIDPFGEPIPGLYECGEIGSVFGQIYLSGGNLAESFVGGGIAGREAAARARGETA